MKKIKLISLGLIMTLLTFTTAASAAYTTYTNQADFLAGLSEYYLYDFNDLDVLPYYYQLGTDSLVVNLDGVSVQADTAATSFASAQKADASTDRSLTNTSESAPIVITFPGDAVYAIGSEVFVCGPNGWDIPDNPVLGIPAIADVYVSVNGDSPITLTYDNSDGEFNRPFFGVISDEGLTSLTITGPGDGEDNMWAAVDNLYVGNAVPLPPSVLLLGTGLLGLGFSRLRKRHRRS